MEMTIEKVFEGFITLLLNTIEPAEEVIDMEGMIHFVPDGKEGYLRLELPRETKLKLKKNGWKLCTESYPKRCGYYLVYKAVFGDGKRVYMDICPDFYAEAFECELWKEEEVFAWREIKLPKSLLGIKNLLIEGEEE